jgi:hypothetical protein
MLCVSTRRGLPNIHPASSHWRHTVHVPYCPGRLRAKLGRSPILLAWYRKVVQSKFGLCTRTGEKREPVGVGSGPGVQGPEDSQAGSDWSGSPNGAGGSLSPGPRRGDPVQHRPPVRLEGGRVASAQQARSRCGASPGRQACGQLRKERLSGTLQSPSNVLTTPSRSSIWRGHSFLESSLSHGSCRVDPPGG